ncbi:MAG: hypothetical protein ABSB69_12425 [Solirubrobacteraceae bacterium]
MSEPAPRRLGRRPAREPKLPSERDWERSAVLEPRAAPRYPELVSDGAALSFPPGALAGPPAPLDPEDPAVRALRTYLATRATPKRTSRARWKRGADAPAPPSVDGWRLLARADGEVLFGRGRPPQLLIVTLRKNALRRNWTCTSSGVARPLRATRDGIRASSWRLDPAQEIKPQETVLRVLLTEQAFASGQSADGRVLPPDLHVDGKELVLTLFVTPRPGYQTATRNPETPVRIALAEPVGRRRLLDGALTFAPPGTGAPASPSD